MHYNIITITNKVAFVLEPFESKELDFQFMAYLPQIWELKQFICADSSILQGNLKSPNIDIQGVTLQNWTDRPLHLEAGQLLYSIEFGEKPEKILCGNRKSEIEMKTIFKSYEFNREELMAQGFMRTIISALTCTRANLSSDFESLEQKQEHITTLLKKGNLGINVLRLNNQGAPQLDFAKNRRALNRVLLSQLLQKKRAHKF